MKNGGLWGGSSLSVGYTAGYSVSSSTHQEVKVSSAPFLLLRIPSLKLRVRGRKEAFEANLKTETELWNLMVKEMWAGRNMADQHKVLVSLCPDHSQDVF